MQGCASGEVADNRILRPEMRRWWKTEGCIKSEKLKAVVAEVLESRTCDGEESGWTESDGIFDLYERKLTAAAKELLYRPCLMKKTCYLDEWRAVASPLSSWQAVAVCDCLATLAEKRTVAEPRGRVSEQAALTSVIASFYLFFETANLHDFALVAEHLRIGSHSISPAKYQPAVRRRLTEMVRKCVWKRGFKVFLSCYFSDSINKWR